MLQTWVLSIVYHAGLLSILYHAGTSMQLNTQEGVFEHESLTILPLTAISLVTFAQEMVRQRCPKLCNEARKHTSNARPMVLAGTMRRQQNFELFPTGRSGW